MANHLVQFHSKCIFICYNRLSINLELARGDSRAIESSPRSTKKRGYELNMWKYREVIINLTSVDLKKRYEHNMLGFLWQFLSPLLLAIVLYTVFHNLFAKEDNFAINLLVGIMAWRFFTTTTSGCLHSIVSRPALVNRVFIPRKILVLSTALGGLISSFLEFIILIPVIFVLLGTIPATIVLYPAVHLLFFSLIYGIGLSLSSIYVYVRDLHQIWPVFLQMLFFLCPIIYPLSIVSPGYMTYYMINPLTRLILIYRDVMVVGRLPSMEDIGIVIGFAALALFVGNYVFSKLERRFAELI